MAVVFSAYSIQHLSTRCGGKRSSFLVKVEKKTRQKGTRGHLSTLRAQSRQDRSSRLLSSWSVGAGRAVPPGKQRAPPGKHRKQRPHLPLREFSRQTRDSPRHLALHLILTTTLYGVCDYLHQRVKKEAPNG